MKISKYCFGLILFTIISIFVSEQYQQHLSEFHNVYETSFYPDEEQYEYFFEDINPEKYDKDVSVFFIYSEYSGYYHTNHHIYCNDLTKQILIEQYKFEEGNSHGLLSGNTTIQYYDIEELPFEYIGNNWCSTYLIGEEDQVVSYKVNLVDKYGGSYPKNDGVDSLLRSTISIGLAWAAVIGVLLCLTYYEVLQMKKESFIQMTMGASTARKVIKSIYLDSFVYILIFIVIAVVSKICFGYLFLFQISIIGLVILLLLNSLIILSQMSMNIKYVFSNAFASNTALNASYLLYALVSVIGLIAISLNIVSIVEYKKLDDQKWFYKKHEGYYTFQFINIDNEDIDVREIQELFYRTHYKDYNISAFGSFYQGDSGLNYVFANSNMKWYVDKLFDTSVSEDERYVCLYPEGWSKEHIYDELYPVEEWFLDAEIDDINDIEFIQYTESISLYNQNAYVEYQPMDNPVILFDSRNNFKLKEIDEESTWLFYDTFYVNCTIDEAQSFAEEYGLKLYYEDVYEEYMYYHTFLLRISISSLIAAIVLLVMQLALMSSIIRLEFETNKYELAIGFTMGYSKLRRYRKLLCLTIVPDCMITATAALISYFLNIGNVFVIAVTGVLLMIAHILVLIVKCNDEDNIIRILKNG